MKNKRTLKGFTLIELLVVMAIFGILMVAVMQILNPLNKLSKRATLQEANAAAVDNIKNYMESSLRYADCVEVCIGPLTDNNGNILKDSFFYTNDDRRDSFGVNSLTDAPKNVTVEEAAVINFLDNHYSNRVEPNTEENVDPASGRVYMLKVDNANGGVISEKVWKFNTGYTYTKFFEKDTKINDEEFKKGDLKKKLNDKGEIVDDSLGRVNAKLIEVVSDEPNVINPVYYDNYSFYIAPGYNNVETVSDDNYIKKAGFKTEDDAYEDYYAVLKPVKSATGNTYSNFSKEMFSLSVVTYKNDKNSKNEPIYRGQVKEKDENDVEHTYQVFQSPFALSNVNMSLVNINSQFSQNKGSDNYGPVRYQGPKDGTDYTPDKKVEAENDHWKYERITAVQAPKIDQRLFVHQPNNMAVQHILTDYNYHKDDGNYELYEDCIYFIFTLPDFK